MSTPGLAARSPGICGRRQSTFLASVPLREIRAFWGIADSRTGGLRRSRFLDLVHDARATVLTHVADGEPAELREVFCTAR